MTWTCAGTVGHFTIFHNELRAPCGRPQCVLPPFAETCSSNSSISYHIISVVNALQAVAQLGDAFIIFCVVRDEHLPIDRSICQSIFSFFRLACCCCCWLRLPYTGWFRLNAKNCVPGNSSRRFFELDHKILHTYSGRQYLKLEEGGFSIWGFAVEISGF